MAVKKKVVEVDTGNAQKSVKSLRNELKELKDQLLNLEKGTIEYNETLQQAANIQHDLKEMNEELAASAMDFGQILSNTTKTVNGAISGFQALSASMTLLGVENKDTLETIKKLQALMALTQGIAGVENGIKAFKRLILAITNSTVVAKLFNKTTAATAVTETAASTATKGLQGAMVGETVATKAATVATHAFKKALIATGIGAIIVLVGTLIAHLEDLAKWLGFSGSSASSADRATKSLEESTRSLDAAIQVVLKDFDKYKYFLAERQQAHQLQIKALELEVQTMEAAGKSEEAIMQKREENFEIVKKLYTEEVKILNGEQYELEQGYQNLFHKALTMNNMFRELQEAEMKQLLLEQELEAYENAEDKDARAIESTKRDVARAKQRVAMLQMYIQSQKEEISMNDKINQEEVKLHNDRRKRNNDAKKLREQYEAFITQLSIDETKNKEKELLQNQKAEKDRLKQLKEYQKQGAITKEEYEKRKLEITELYAKYAIEIEAKYAQQEAKKREDQLKKLFDIEKSELQRQQTEKQSLYDQEHQQNVEALRKREISMVEYYEKEKELATKAYEDKVTLSKTLFEKEKAVITKQIAERENLLNIEGLTDEEKERITTEQAQLFQQLATLETEHAVSLAELSQDILNEIADLNQSVIEEQIESLRMLTENVVGAMESITSVGEGLSSQWATAFDTMSNGLINLGQKIKEGGAQWQDYGQLAVAAFQAAGSVMSALADQQGTETKEGFEQQKKYQIAAVTMNMLGGVISAWTSAMNPANAWMTIWGQLAMGAASTAMILATGIMQIQKIKQLQFDAGGGSTSNPSGGSMGNLLAPVQYTQDIQGAEIEGAIKDSKVYVVESDITDAQNRVDVTENEAKY